jgi:microcystin-dependent protein
MSSFSHDNTKCLVKNLSNLGTIIVKCKSSNGNEVEIAKFSSSGIQLKFTDQTQNISYTPTGTILAFAGIINNVRPNNNLPLGYLWCNGQQYSTSEYKRLHDVIGYRYGGSGSNFNVPNLSKKFVLGADNTNSMNVEVISGGVTTTSYVGGNSKITINQMASHTHAISFNTNQYIGSVNTQNNNTSVNGNLSRLTQRVIKTFPTITNTTGKDANMLDDYMPPWTSIQYIIKY